MDVVKVSLNGKWQFRELTSSRWYTGTVPGTVHQDLLRNDLIPDPYFRMNEKKIQWVADKSWIYRKEFIVTPEISNRRYIELIFQGIDTVAEIYVNGKRLAHTENMFVPVRILVKGILKAGLNVIEVKLISPVKECRIREHKYGKLNSFFYSSRPYLRKAQYSFGWDWGPCIPSSGIWQNVELIGYDFVRISNVWVKPELDTNLRDAKINITTNFENPKSGFFSRRGRLQNDSGHKTTPAPTNLVLCTEVSFAGKLVKSIETSIGSSQKTVQQQFRITNPYLWWPKGYGEQNLYKVEVILRSRPFPKMVLGQVRVDYPGGEDTAEIIDICSTKFGFRKVELIQEPVIEGKTFYFRVNNVPVFAKGCNWIPADTFLPAALQTHRYEKLLSLVKHSNMNMLRVWGGGIYEPDEFYQFCDEFGIIVWQDFMYACAEYPELTWFYREVKKETAYHLIRLRNHPSILLWCGNNENDLFRRWDKNIRLTGDKIFTNLIAELCGRLDGTRPYIPTSPVSDEKCFNSQSTGDRHSWDVWSSWQDWVHYKDDKGRFISEFGFQSLPNVDTVKKFTFAIDRNATSKVMEFHNKQTEGTERIWRYLTAHFGVPRDFNEYIYWSQLNQGEALSYGIRHWRRRKFKTGGTLIWQLNDSWPGISWSLIDYYLNPKQSYYLVNRAFTDVMLDLLPEEENIIVWVVNDRVTNISGILNLKLLDFKGKILKQWQRPIKVPANKSVCVYRIKKPDLKNLLNPETETKLFLAGTLKFGNNETTDKNLFFVKNKHLELPVGKPIIKIVNNQEKQVKLVLESKVLLKYLTVEFPFPSVEISDYGFDLIPNQRKEILLTTKQHITVVQLMRNIKWRSYRPNKEV